MLFQRLRFYTRPPAAIVVGLCLFVSLGRLSAAEVNIIRLGGDYDQFSARSEKTCDEKCQRDPRCQSWSYIKPRRSRAFGQCRLKHLIAPAFENRCCVSGTKQKVVNAELEEERCARFATQAVDQNDSNRAQRCGYSGELWHSNYDRQFQRCLKIGHGQQEAEYKERTKDLDECANVANQSKQLRCEHYTRISIEQNTTNTKNNCRFDSKFWHSNSKAHFTWCNQTTRAEVEQIRNQRENKLHRCMVAVVVKTPERSFHNCRNKSAEMVALNDRQIRMRCGYRKNVWHSNFQLHYRSCATDPQRFDSQLVEVQGYIDRCIRKRKKWQFILDF